jgi:hypothetical protein
MGIDLYDWDAEHIIFRRTIIMLPHESIVNRPRTKLCCDLLKGIIYDRPRTGYIYAHTHHISRFKSDLMTYINQNLDSSKINTREKLQHDLDKSMLCTIELCHSPIKTNDNTENIDKRLYLTDEEKTNFHSSVDISCLCLDPLLSEHDFSDDDVKEKLLGLYGNDGWSTSAVRGKPFISLSDILSSLVLKPTMFGVGIDLNKAIERIRSKNKDDTELSR